MQKVYNKVASVKTINAYNIYVMYPSLCIPFKFAILIGQYVHVIDLHYRSQLQWNELQVISLRYLGNREKAQSTLCVCVIERPMCYLSFFLRHILNNKLNILVRLECISNFRFTQIKRIFSNFEHTGWFSIPIVF